MSIRSVERIDRVEGDVHVGDKFYTMASSYSTDAECYSGDWTYRPFWAAATLYFLVFIFWVWQSFHVLSDMHYNGIITPTGWSSQWAVFEALIFAAAMIAVYLALPLLSDRFRVFFDPVEWTLVVGGDTIYLKDVLDHNESGGALVLTLRNGETRRIYFSHARYVDACMKNTANHVK